MSRGSAPGVELEFVLQFPAVAPEDHVDTRPQLAVDELLIGLDIGRRVSAGAGELAHRPGRRLACLQARVRACAHEPQLESETGDILAVRPHERQYCLLVREEEGIAGTARHVTDGIVRLPGVRRERERKIAGRIGFLRGPAGREEQHECEDCKHDARSEGATPAGRRSGLKD